MRWRDCVCNPDEVFRGQEPSSGAGRTVSAADVVLFGVNIVLPLMSQDLLKVRLILYHIIILISIVSRTIENVLKPLSFL